jgi:hypothetical protein
MPLCKGPLWAVLPRKRLSQEQRFLEQDLSSQLVLVDICYGIDATPVTEMVTKRMNKKVTRTPNKRTKRMVTTTGTKNSETSLPTEFMSNQMSSMIVI